MLKDEFVLSLKMGNQVFKLTLKTGDDKDVVFEKLMEVHPGCEGRK